jgi:hypothetical protein
MSNLQINILLNIQLFNYISYLIIDKSRRR